MEILNKIVTLLLRLPDWAFLCFMPACLAAAAIAFVFVRKKGWFYLVALILCAAGSLAVYVKEPSLMVVYACVFAVLTGALSLLFLIPCGRKKEVKRKKTQDEKMYEKFHEELSEQPYAPQKAKMPPKVCCFETRSASSEENGMRLSYAESLLKKLRAQKLNAGDRLETEELSRRLDLYKKNALSEEERNTLNDCLASILKLTAKYNL